MNFTLCYDECYQRNNCSPMYTYRSLYFDREVSYAEEFLTLPVDKVVSILRRNRLAVETENAIFDAIMRWVRHGVKERQCHLKTLITDCVHPILLDERYVKVVF